jgi:Protein of unknown function (DUF1549)/Protein of unknown function (DUF1553)
VGRLVLAAAMAAGLIAAPPQAKIVSIRIEPPQVKLTGKWASQSLLVTGKLADGTVRDLTARAQFKSARSKIAEVSKAGVITPVAEGAAAISVSIRGVKKISIPVIVENVKNASASFVNHMRPILSKLGCNSGECHGAQKGRGGLRLSLFGGEPEADFEALTKAAQGRRINRAEPMKSLLLAKSTGALGHKAALRPGTPEYEIVVSWLVHGTPWNLDKEPQIVRLQVFPETRVLSKGDAQQLLVTAVYSDGATKDVTRDSVYQTSNRNTASVSAAGRVEAGEFGESVIIVNYLRRAGIARVAVPQILAQPLPPFKPNNQIDEFVASKLKSLGIPPSAASTDAEFLRRAFLDVIGILPTADEARAFLADRDPERRAKLIDRLLDREEFADFWSLKWGDLLRIKSEYPVRVWPKAVAVYYRWVHESIRQNKPYDQFVRELLTANGSNFRNAPVNFYRANASKDPRTLGETTALVFMGARVGCARCHAHPSENWNPDDDLAFGAFFSKVNFKSTLEWKEEIVYPDPKAMLRNPRTREAVQPRFPGVDTLTVTKDEDARARFAAWLTSPENPWFARNIANRIWFWLLGRGIVHEPDDLRPTNPPENPELLAYLEKELTDHHYDLKHLYRLILNSRTYQLSSAPNQWNVKDFAHFSHYPARRLGAEQLLDAISAVTETSEKFRSIIPEPFTNWPAGSRATQISDGNAECSFLDLFGRPPRDTPYEEERNSDVSLKQALYFLNSEQLDGKITGSPRLKRMLASNKSEEDLVDELYLTMLSRFPSAEEKQNLVQYLAKKKAARAQAVQDAVWAVMNSKEFIFNH